MRPEVAATLLLWTTGLIVTLAVVVVVLLVERVRDRRLRDRLVDAAMRDGKVIVARNEEITALRAENDGLSMQVMMQATEIEALSALSGDRQPRQRQVPELTPDPVWADIVRRLGDSS